MNIVVTSPHCLLVIVGWDGSDRSAEYFWILAAPSSALRSGDWVRHLITGFHLVAVGYLVLGIGHPCEEFAGVARVTNRTGCLTLWLILEVIRLDVNVWLQAGVTHYWGPAGQLAESWGGRQEEEEGKRKHLGRCLKDWWVLCSFWFYKLLLGDKNTGMFTYRFCQFSKEIWHLLIQEKMLCVICIYFFALYNPSRGSVLRGVLETEYKLPFKKQGIRNMFIIHDCYNCHPGCPLI